MKFTIANFATKNVTAIQLFPLFWKAVGILEERCKLKVMAVTSDGASANRTMYQMRIAMKHTTTVNYEERDIVYKTKNRHSEDNRDIYFISDYPHLLKTGRNHLAHSGFDKNFSRLLWNDNKYLTWSHVKDLMLEDLDCGLQLCPKITTEHIKLTPFSVMNVRLAAQVLSISVIIALKSFGPPEAILPLPNIVKCLTSFLTVSMFVILRNILPNKNLF